jgi:hypothetical protein
MQCDSAIAKGYQEFKRKYRQAYREIAAQGVLNWKISQEGEA